MYIYALIQNPRIICIYNLLFTILIEIFFAYPPFFSAIFLCTVLNPISVLELLTHTGLIIHFLSYDPESD